MPDFILNVCDVCRDMLQTHKGYHWYGTYDLTFDHHDTWEKLEESKNKSCCICRAIFERIDSDDTLSHIAKSHNSPAIGDPDSKIEVPKSRSVPLLRAGLSLVKNPKDLEDLKGPNSAENVNGLAKEPLYRVNFTLQGYNRVGSFVLNPGSYDEESIPATRISNHTGSKEVFETASEWLKICETEHNCWKTRPEGARNQYPTRLIDLSTSDQGFVRLVVTRRRRFFDGRYWMSFARSIFSWPFRKSGSRLKLKDEYMTLSHRWGDADPLKLTWSNVKKFLWSGIPIDKLPKTFKDAIEFANYLGVGYLWIDSLCIVQEDKNAGKHEDEAKKLHEMDWREESKHMMEVYGGSYLNISATHGGDCGSGLFRDRNGKKPPSDFVSDRTTERWWTGYTPVWVHKVPGVHTMRDQSLFGVPGKDPPIPCQVQNQTFWDIYVGDSALNKRAWVLQERLMAPRVIHFCKDQIAWECCELNATESLPEGVPPHSRKLKGLDPKYDGFPLYRKRFSADIREISEEDKTILGALEIWKQTVEMYSRTQLTNRTDRLIALSGIAKNLRPHIGGDYLAGLWSKKLAGQLLWYVKPEYRRSRDYRSQKGLAESAGTLYYPGTRSVEEYIAPTWSWASVIVENPVEIVYGAITLRDSEIEIEDGRWQVESQEGSDKLGLLKKGASIEVTGKLKMIQLVWEEHEARPGNPRFTWKPYNEGRRVADKKDIKDIYWNVYLDCYKTDLVDVEEQPVYCFPVGTDEKDYFCCLLLRKDLETHVFKRIGLIRNPSFDPSGRKTLEKYLEGVEKITITIL
ncbi:uncharacterized protein PAC_02793 [Phialocephala subalpina]|uniref:Heterokaryon incompatibility domain-containing protein n=1 Tax=Phialocephala subalpina TaxID=576137 RepID=A0A1L7WJH1_9HELO|nr:uncharacterized protein PAC_02793 [Phialocephala subalpina]